MKVFLTLLMIIMIVVFPFMHFDLPSILRQRKLLGAKMCGCQL